MKLTTTLGVLVVLTLTFAGSSLTAKKGGRPGGGGVCSVSTAWRSSFMEISRLDPPSLNPILKGRRLGNEMAVMAAGADILVVLQSSETANVASRKWLTTLIFDGVFWTFVDSWEIDPELRGTVHLADVDQDGTADLVHASGIYLDVFDVLTGSTPDFQILPPPDSESFGSGWAVGDVEANPGQEIVVGDRGQNAIYVFDAEGYPLGKLRMATEDFFGDWVLISPSSGLFVGARWAELENKNRDSGKVFHFPSVVACDGTDCVPSAGEPLTLTRGIKNEELGKEMVLGDIDNSGVKDLIVKGGRFSESLAVFHEGGSGATSALDLTPPFGLIDSLSASNVAGETEADVFAGASNAGADSGSCSNVGAVYGFLDGEPSPVIIRTPADTIEDHLFFGRATAAVGSYLFVTEMGRDVDGDGSDDGQIYVLQSVP